MNRVMIGAILSPEEELRQRNLALGIKAPSGGGGGQGPGIVESGTKILDTLSSLFNRKSSGGGTVPYQPEPTRPATGNGFLDSTPFGGQLKMKTVLLFAGLGVGGYLLYKNMKK